MKVFSDSSEQMTAFENVDFITAAVSSGSSQFRRKFTVAEKGAATLRVCGLGYGYFWLNGKKVSQDLFTAPVSDYRKTLWYNEYDVTSLIKKGENVFAVWLGNGFFNEGFDSAWNHNKVSWREPNKFILELYIDGVLAVCSDEKWKSNPRTAVVYNELRSGETFDYNVYDEKWNTADFDDGGWDGVVKRGKNPAVVMRKCQCQPIREICLHSPASVTETESGILIDFGTNMAGYVRLRFCGGKGDEITIRHAESAGADNELELNGLNIYYQSVPFQTDKIICDGKEHTYTPMFTYHGFRFVKISGINDKSWTCQGVEVYQQIEKIADFECSDETLNKLYKAAIRSSYSNFHYAVTDCPTREKLGWCNDAAASLKQFFINFDIAPLLEKWYVDIIDTQREDGAVSGIAPSPDWGYGLGAVTDICLFALPAAFHQYNGDGRLLKKYSANLVSYYDFYYPKISGKDAFFGLGDWNGSSNHPTDLKFIELAYALIMQRHLKTIAKIDPRFDGSRFINDEQETLKRLSTYFSADGSCNVPTVTAVSMAMYLGLGNFYTLKEQLIDIIKKRGGDIDCGMVGRQFFFKVTGKAGLTRLAIDTLTRGGDYKKMVDEGDTLWETCSKSAATVSRNHHMYSNFVEIFFDDILGIKEGDGKIVINPELNCGLSFAKGHRRIHGKDIFVDYAVSGDSAAVCITCPEDGFAFFNGKPLSFGENKFMIKV